MSWNPSPLEFPFQGTSYAIPINVSEIGSHIFPNITVAARRPFQYPATAEGVRIFLRQQLAHYSNHCIEIHQRCSGNLSICCRGYKQFELAEFYGGLGYGLDRKFLAISSLLNYGYSCCAGLECIQNHRGTVCQGSIWFFGGSMHHSATFYGDINWDHNYDERGQELG